MTTFISIMTSVVLALIFVGIILGFFRGWVKSLIRMGCVLVSLLLAIFIGPAISGKLVEKFVQGTSFVGFGLSVDFEESLTTLFGDANFSADLLAANGTTHDLAVAVINVVLNIVCFLLIFFAVYLLSLLIYWIVILVIAVRKRKEKTETQKTASYWWLKVLGGGIGIFASLMFCFVLLTPVFGVMNICNKFLTTENTKQTANAVSAGNYVCGELYYTEDKNIGKVEGYIQTYADIKETYDDSFIGKFFNFTGISKAGSATFNYLTNVKSDGLKLNVTNEFVALIKTYNIYKINFVEGKFDLADNECLDGVMEIYELANESEIVTNYIEEFVPKFCERWIAGEKFLGIAMPVKGEFEPIAREILQVFKTTNTTRIKSNVKAVIEIVKTANNHEVIKNVREGKDLIAILSNDDSLVKDEILVLSSTNELKVATPNIFFEFTKIAYDKVVGGEAQFEEVELTNQQIDAINWNTEAQSMQYLFDNLLEVYNATKDNSSSDVMIDQLTNVGEAIDNARMTTTVSGPFKVFIEGFIKSDKVKLEADVKETIASTISNHWDDENYSFAVTFSAIEETAKVARSILKAAGSVDLNNLSTVLKEIISSDSAKTTINTILTNDAIVDLVGGSSEASAMTDILDTLVNDTDAESIDSAITAAQEVVNIVSSSKGENGLTLSGETTEEKQATAEQMIENIASSDVMMDLLNDATNDATSPITDLTNGLGGDIDILKDSIDSANISDEKKAILNNLFS